MWKVRCVHFQLTPCVRPQVLPSPWTVSLTPNSELPLPSSGSVLPDLVLRPPLWLMGRTDLSLGRTVSDQHFLKNKKPCFRIFHIPDMGGDCCSFL